MLERFLWENLNTNISNSRHCHIMSAGHITDRKCCKCFCQHKNISIFFYDLHFCASILLTSQEVAQFPAWWLCTVCLIMTCPLDEANWVNLEKVPVRNRTALMAGFSQHTEGNTECCYCHWQQEVTENQSGSYWKLPLLTEWNEKCKKKKRPNCLL